MNFSKIAAASVCVIAISACQPGGSSLGGQDKTSLDNEAEKISYAMGMDIGNSLKQFDADIDMAALNQGIKDTLGDAERLLTDEEVRQVMTDFSAKIQARKQKEQQEQLAANGAASSKFLDANKGVEGVQVTESGLQYIVLEASEGDKPDEDDKVKVHYRGTLIDGTEFDSSYSRNQPASFPLNAVIPGWTEGLQLMTVGSKYRFFIPPELGYGERGAGDRIGPNQALIFDVELLEIEG